MALEAPSPQPTDARQWPKVLARYREPSNGRSITEIVITAFPLIALWFTMWASLHLVGYWLALLLAIPAAGFLVRLFMIQHDCSHGSFFGRRKANDWVGRVIGVFTLTPHDLWRHAHAIHHAGSGNLDHRGIGDVTTMTVAEYRKLGWRGRLGYRLYRNPVILFVLGPAYLFLLQHRIPLGQMGKWQPWFSTMLTNLGIAAVAGGVIWFTGLGAFLMVHLPIAIFAASIGVWLFYVQHQFEHTTWRPTPTGVTRRRRSTAARTMTSRRCYAGSPPILACITSITCLAAFPIIACRRCSAIIPSLPMSGVSACSKASDVSRLFCGMRASGVWSRSARCGGTRRWTSAPHRRH